jgi:hemoglobin
MKRRTVPWLLLALVACGCMEGKKTTPLVRTPTLYTRLGGEPAISKVVDDLCTNMIASDKIRDDHKEHLLKPDIRPVKRKLIDQIGEATGGPQTYTGKSMLEAHRGLGITNAEFDATVAALVKAMDTNKVSKEEQDKLLKLLAPMRSDIVEGKE